MKESLVKVKLFLILGSTLLLGACSSIVADNSCGTTDLSAIEMQQTFVMGKDLEAALNRLNSDVVIVARSGQDLEKYGIRYSHAAFMVKDRQEWQVYHLLNECPSSYGGLYQEGLGNFVMPAMVSTKLKNGTNDLSKPEISFGFAIPPKPVQQNLKRLLQDSAARNSVFEKQYSAVANPYNQINQNSNGWVLEFYTIAEAQANKQIVNNRDDAQAWLKSQDYEGTELPASILKQRLAAMVVGNVSLKGHERSDRYQGKLLINSGDSVLNYVAGKNGAAKCRQSAQIRSAKDAAYCELIITQ